MKTIYLLMYCASAWTTIEDLHQPKADCRVISAHKSFPRAVQMALSYCYPGDDDDEPERAAEECRGHLEIEELELDDPSLLSGTVYLSAQPPDA